MIKITYYLYSMHRVNHEFNSYKTMSQYIRRNKIKEFQVYENNKLMVLLNNNYWPVELLEQKIKEASTMFDKIKLKK